MITPEEFDPRLGSVLSTGLIKLGDPDPRTYLEYAEEDLGGEDCPRRRINALSNGKRALHLQIELLTDALGYLHWKAKGRDGFPRRLEFLSHCGLISPRILTKINRLRNDVEHDYVDPDRGVIEDYLEVVALYLEASDRFVRSFPRNREARAGHHEDGTKYCLLAKRGSATLDLYQGDYMEILKSTPGADSPLTSTPADERAPVGIEPVLTIRLAEDSEAFFDWIRLLLGVSR